ncbi:MAG: hypothetical protein AAFZ49_00640 [Cyanobacteria bacterium J06659_2]
MTTERLERIEDILAALAESQRASDERLTRTEAICESNAKAIEANSNAIAATQAIADSNARAIAAWGDRIEEVAVETEEIATATRQDLSEQINLLGRSLQGLIRERRDDWSQWREQQSQVDQRFNNLLEDARADRKRNQQEHTAFRESFQTLLGEIRSIWQRLNAS